MDKPTPDLIKAGIKEVKLLIQDSTTTPEDYVRRIYEAMVFMRGPRE